MLKVENLQKSFFTEEIETVALNGVSFEVKEGEFVAIMGPSGCGKSTLLNILGLLDNPTGGSYQLLDKEGGGLKEKEGTEDRKGNIGYVFQAFNLIDELSVAENVELPLIYMGVKPSERKERVKKMLDRMNISHRAGHFPQQLSGGQQQRVAIARALVSNPKLILADEPTGNLDSRASHIIMEELQDIHSLGNTIIMVTHNPALTTYATRVINMLDGEIDTDIKTVADQDLPKPGDPEKISVRVLSKKKKAVELEVDSSSPVIVSGNNITIAGLDDDDDAKESSKKSEKKSTEPEEKEEKKPRTTRSRFGNILKQAKKAKNEKKDKTKKKTKIEIKSDKSDKSDKNKNTKSKKKES